MGNPFEQKNRSTRDSEERKKFDSAPAEEQIQRYKKVSELLDDNSVFRDFVRNAYKHPDEFIMKGTGGLSVLEILSILEHGLELLKPAIELFLQIKKRESQGENKLDESKTQLTGDMSRNLGRNIFIEKNQRKLNSNQLQEIFRLSLEAFVNKGEKLGRIPNIRKEEIPGIVDDLSAMLEAVNRYL